MLVSSSAAARLDYLAVGWRPWVLLGLLSLALFLPGIASLPPVDRDEARYIQATRQMLESRDFVQIRFQDEARNKKPGGIYWLQAAIVATVSEPASTSVWPYRLVSVAGGVASVLLTFLFGSSIFDRRTALLAAGLLAASVDLVVEAHVATTDAALLPTAIVAQGVLALAYLAYRRNESLPLGAAFAFWVALGAASLIKGPVVPGLTALSTIALVVADRRARWLLALRPQWGAPLLVAIVAPWLVLVEQATDGAFLRSALGSDFGAKLAGGQESHGAFPGYYLALLPVTFWPGSLFLALAAVWAWRTRRLPASRVLLAWVLPFWVILELVPTKLPHYVLPLYPGLALACARAAIACGEEGMAPPGRRWRLAVGLLWTAIGLAVAGTFLMLPPILGGKASAAAAVGVAGIIAVAWHILVRGKAHVTPNSAAMAILAAMMVFVPGLSLVLPDLSPVWLSRSAQSLVAAERLPGETIAATGYAEPSLVFLLGTDTKLVSAEAAATALADGTVALALVTQAEEAPFRQALASRGITPSSRGEADGFDYSNGKWLSLRLYRGRTGS